ncbi:MAG: hypothetical protein HUU50_07735 [Candidatus Brocadiae bacterium]|nr:hypothetical protein [Candidatus Brocadiia bacterium]
MKAIILSLLMWFLIVPSVLAQETNSKTLELPKIKKPWIGKPKIGDYIKVLSVSIPANAEIVGIYAYFKEKTGGDFEPAPIGKGSECGLGWCACPNPYQIISSTESKVITVGFSNWSNARDRIGKLEVRYKNLPDQKIQEQPLQIEKEALLPKSKDPKALTTIRVKVPLPCKIVSIRAYFRNGAWPGNCDLGNSETFVETGIGDGSECSIGWCKCPEPPRIENIEEHKVVTVDFANWSDCNARTGKLEVKYVLQAPPKDAIEAIVKEVESDWMDQDGFLRLTPTPGQRVERDNENPVLFTGEYVYLLWKLGVLKGELRERYKKHLAEKVGALRLEPGLFNRRPGQTQEAFERHFSRDEQIGLVAMDMVFDWELGFAKEIYEYGKNNGWCWQNRDWSAPGEHKRKAAGDHNSPTELYISGLRQPHFIDYLRVAIKQTPSDFGLKIYRSALALTRGRPREDTSGKLLACLHTQVMRNCNDQETLDCIEKFWREMTAMYGANPIHGMMKIYFQHPDHPFLRLSNLLQ